MKPPDCGCRQFAVFLHTSILIGVLFTRIPHAVASGSSLSSLVVDCEHSAGDRTLSATLEKVSYGSKEDLVSAQQRSLQVTKFPSALGKDDLKSAAAAWLERAAKPDAFHWPAWQRLRGVSYVGQAQRLRVVIRKLLEGMANRLQRLLR